MRARMCVPLIKTKEERRARLVPCRMGHDVWANREKETIKAIYIKKKKKVKTQLPIWKNSDCVVCVKPCKRRKWENVSFVASVAR